MPSKWGYMYQHLSRDIRCVRCTAKACPCCPCCAPARTARRERCIRWDRGLAELEGWCLRSLVVGGSDVLNFYKHPATSEPLHVDAQQEAMAVFREWAHTAQQRLAAMDARAAPKAPRWKVGGGGLEGAPADADSMRQVAELVTRCVLAGLQRPTAGAAARGHWPRGPRHSAAAAERASQLPKVHRRGPGASGQVRGGEGREVRMLPRGRDAC